MPSTGVTITINVGDVRVTGIGKLERRLYDVITGVILEVEPQLRRRFLEEYGKEVERVIIPILRPKLPRRTGRLRASLRLERRGNRLILSGVFYANFVRFPGSVRDLFLREFNKHKTDMTRRAFDRARRGII